MARAEAALKEQMQDQIQRQQDELAELRAQAEQAGKEQKLAVAQAEAALKEQLQKKIQCQQDELVKWKAQAELAEKQAVQQEKTLRESWMCS